MPLYGARGGYLSTADWDDLAKKVVLGDGLGWPGDDRMELRIGVLENAHKSGHRLEVHRYNEDGTFTLVGHWLPTESMRVCYDLAQMRVDSPGHVSVVDRIDAHNDALEKQRSEESQAAMYEILDHALHLQHDRHNPKSKFYGIKETLPDGKLPKKDQANAS